VNKIFQLLLLTIVLLQPVSLSAALSLEALEMVEQLRRNLNGQNTQTVADADIVEKISPKSSEPEQYVVGMELRNALKRLRRAVYGSETPERKIPALSQAVEDRAEIISHSVEEEEVPELYVAGVELKDAIARIRATRDPSEICNDVDKRAVDLAVSADLVVEPDEERVESVVDSVDRLEDEVVAPVTAAVAETKSYENDDESDALKLKFKKLVSAQKAAPVEEKADSSKDLDKLHDKVINREIKKHEFKMPENYRIIVR
jgi:hypothetical protein